MAAGRAGRDGPAGRVLQAAPGVRFGRGAGAVQPHRRRNLLPRAEPVERAGGGSGPCIRASPRPARPTASCSSTTGPTPPPHEPSRWENLRTTIRQHGLRNSLLIAIAPTATIASIAGCYECIEPQVSNLFKRETLSGDFLQVNRYLADELKSLGLWTAEVRDQIKLAEGSIQGIAAIPERLRADLPHRVGAAAESTDRTGRRPRRLHRPEPVAEPVHGEPEHRTVELDVHVRVEGRHQDHVLPALQAGDEDRQGNSECGEGGGRRWPSRIRPMPRCSARWRIPEYCEACQ